jgi:uncharacterized protein YfaQ (DUF2300 family)
LRKLLSSRFKKIFLVAPIVVLATSQSDATRAKTPIIQARVLTTSGEYESLNISANMSVGLSKNVSAAVSAPPATSAPLGSLWKIFAYSYLVDENLPENSYRCLGTDPDEIFCCKPGESIDREMALAKSCTPYFSFSRLGISKDQWTNYWRNSLSRSNLSSLPTWLSDRDLQRPETRVPVDELLNVLSAIRTNLPRFKQIEHALLGTILNGTARGSFPSWGGLLRVKTYTWRDQPEDAFIGGFAGWLPDGSAIWVSGEGHGRDMFVSDLRTLVAKHSSLQDDACVDVEYFKRYPISSVHPKSSGKLLGATTVRFKNGNALKFVGDGSLEAIRVANETRIRSRMRLEDYVARVIDREVAAEPEEAARAFAIAIRTYLFQRNQGIQPQKSVCLHAEDSSHFQRVSPSPASRRALSISRWANGLILNGVEDLRYHSNKASKNVMAWTVAKDRANSGLNAKEILNSFFPSGVLTSGSRTESYACVLNKSTANWLANQIPRWRRHLAQIQGFEEPKGIKVCFDRPRVFSHLEALEIYVPRVMTRNDEISVAHEYLHLAFRHHPRGLDENFIETQARNLVEGVP